MRFDKIKARGRARVLGLALLFALALAGGAGAATRRAFLAGLFDARGLTAGEGQPSTEAEKAAFMLRTGLVTDAAGDLNAQVTRREALRWCVQSLGLSFEAGVLSNIGSGFKDAGSLTDFERGCLFVGLQMKPPLLSRAETFRGAQRLTDKEGSALLQRVGQAGKGLSLDVTLAPLNGLSLLLHRDGVPTGIPRWRVYADGFEDKAAADAAQKFFKSQGFDLSPLQPYYEWFLRTPLLDDYGVARRLAALIKKRGLGVRILPSLSNPDAGLLPHYWAMLIIDPTFWRIAPIASGDGPRALAPLSRIARENGVGTAINAGFFAVTGRNRGYPIGVLRVEGELLNGPYEGRSCLGWNDDDEFLLGPVSLFGDSLIGADGALWDEMTSIIQAGPLLLDDGEPRRDAEGFNSALITARHPRSVVGLTEDGCWFLLVVDGRNGLHASGATLSELTEILRAYRVPCALNLDGGGSTELIVNGKIYNAPSEGKERVVSYGLGLKPR